MNEKIRLFFSIEAIREKDVIEVEMTLVLFLTKSD